MKKPEPCFENLLKVLRREPTSKPVLFEFFLNIRLYRTLLGTRYDDAPGERAYLRNAIRSFAEAGYDHATFEGGNLFTFNRHQRERANTVSLNDGVTITDRGSFDAFEWPDMGQVDFSLLNYVEDFMPPGMKLMICTPDGILENVIGLVGYENLCMQLADDPELVSDVFEKVGQSLLEFYQRALAHRSVGLVMVNDDMGFKTQPLLSPAVMKRYVLPWHIRYVEAAHAAGRPAVLHSCGQLESLMDAIIDDAKFDGKHSFEDAICPVEKAYERWGRRIAILGGLDVDFVVRATPDEIYQRAKRMVETARVGYALGTGNSVPTYVPDENYFAMTRAVREL
jgi:uroporphyrinogen decarboxylase